MQACKIALIYVSNSAPGIPRRYADWVPPSPKRAGCFLSCPLFIPHRSCLDSGATSVSRPQHSFACSVESGQLSLAFKHLNKKTFPHLFPSFFLSTFSSTVDYTLCSLPAAGLLLRGIVALQFITHKEGKLAD